MRRWGLKVMQVECLHVHGLTPLDLVCQQALELFLPIIIWRGRKWVQKSAECSCPSWPCILLLWLVCSWREQRGWKEEYQVCIRQMALKSLRLRIRNVSMCMCYAENRHISVRPSSSSDSQPAPAQDWEHLSAPWLHPCWCSLWTWSTTDFSCQTGN